MFRCFYRYNVYGTPLSPILEERESNVTSESLMSSSREASIASRESMPSEDVLLVDTRTNEMILLEGLVERLQDEDRDTTNGDLSEEENLDYTCSMCPLENKPRFVKTNGGAPLPSPEEESKWQQLPSPFPLPLPLPLQDDLMSTSFASERECCSQDEDEEEEEEEDREEEEEEDDEDEDNSSSSGEFVWKVSCASSFFLCINLSNIFLHFSKSRFFLYHSKSRFFFHLSRSQFFLHYSKSRFFVIFNLDFFFTFLNLVPNCAL